MNKWLAFWILAFIWGSSYLFISIGVQQVSPFQLVFIRTAIAAIGLNIVLALRGKHLPFKWRGFLPLLVLGVINTLLPFALITWGEQFIDSSVASVLNATAAFFTLIIGHFMFADERITLRKLAGIALGFVGVFVLTAGSFTGLNPETSNLLGELAIICAALCYGIGGNYGRGVLKKLNDPFIVSAGAMTSAAVLSGILMLVSPALGGQPPTPFYEIHGDALAALIILGLVNTFIAYLLYYYVIQQLGATRASMVTYVIPPIGIALGAIVLSEPVDAGLLVGTALILAGLAVVNLAFFSRRAVKPAAPALSEAAAGQD